MSKNETFKKYLAVHDKMISQHGFTEKALWGSKKSQQIRFKKLSELIKTKRDFSILDIGCGLCDYYSFLVDNGFENFNYTGVEINEVFFNEAKKKFPNLTIFHGSIEKLNSDGEWDYVVASGIYNLGESCHSTEKFFLEQFLNLYPRINHGFAVNFLSSFSEQKDSESIYHDPVQVLKDCINNFSKYVILHHDYLPHDFTIFVFKEQQL